MFIHKTTGELDLESTLVKLEAVLNGIDRNLWSPIVESVDNFERSLLVQSRLPSATKIIFDLCGVLKGAIPGSEPSNFHLREALEPFVVRFVYALGEKRDDGDSLVDFDEDEIALFFDNAWRTRKFSKRMQVLDDAAEFAVLNALEIKDNKYFAWVLNMAAYLQNLQRGQPFLLPVNERTAKLAGTSTVTLSLAIKRAIAMDLLVVVQKADRMRGMSRLLKFNHNHSLVKARMRDFNQKVREFTLERVSVDLDNETGS